MRTVLRARSVLPATAAACCALLLASGCGSSGSGSGAAATASTSSNGQSSPSPSSNSNSTSTSSGSHAELKASTTPKFASPSPSAPVKSGVVPIAYRNIAIAPDTVRVKAGSTVKWTNYDSVPCNVTSKGGVTKFASGSFGEGESYEVTLNTPGIIHYECTLYPTTMNGTIEVVK
jgi:plastocyanin